MDYFKRQIALLQAEQDEDKRAYRELTERTSITDRRESGLAWYPIAIRGTELSKAEYITVEVERATHRDIPHQLRFGVSATLFSNHDPKESRVDGTVTFQGGDRLKLSLRADELPDWAEDGKLGIDLLFDDNSYQEMLSALKYADALGEKSKDGHLVNVLTGHAAPAFDTDVYPYTIPSLNEAQQRAVHKILAARDVAIVHGPPGTGKTTTLVQAIKALVKRDDRQVLVVAPSNTAVDLLSERLAEEGLDVVRVGNPARVSERLMSLTLDSRVSGHPSIKQIKELKKRASEFKNMAHKYKRNFGRAEREQRKALFDEARKIMKDADNTEQYIVDDVLSKAKVITATLVGANHYTVRGLKYDTVVIDEAGQALEPACWIPIVKANKVIFAGDHQQLPPTIKSTEAAKNGLGVTLMEKCIALYPEAVVLLEEQYRMHERVMGYSSKVFYEDRLKAHASVAGRLLFDGDSPFMFIDTAGSGYDELNENTAIANPEEGAFLMRHLSSVVAGLGERYGSGNPPSVGIISPYSRQVGLLKDLLAHAPDLKGYAGGVSVNTIDGFQGQERDIIYISMVRSNADGVIGFLSDIRRMNVAMTRARKKLVIIGDSATLTRLPFYAGLVAYAEQHNAYHSVWEFME